MRVCVWLPPKVVPTCCLLRFIALSSNDAAPARHAKAAGCGPAQRSQEERKEAGRAILESHPTILFALNKSLILE